MKQRLRLTGGFLDDTPKPPRPGKNHEPSKNPKTMLELGESMCRFPIGDPGEKGFHFCGCKSSPGDPYCAKHMRVAYSNLVPANESGKMARSVV